MLGKRYEISVEIGHGAMGRVYHALDRLTGQEVALKRVKPHVAAAAQSGSSDEIEPDEGTTYDLFPPRPEWSGSDLDERTLVAPGAHGAGLDGRLALAREFRLLSSLHHPNVIRVLDYGFEEGLPFYTMELLSEPRTVLEAARGRSVEEKAGLLIQMLQALAYLHRRGVMHRDVKPSNALVEADPSAGGRLKLLDFGISELRGQSTRAGVVAGTPSYMAVELLRGKPASESADLFAVGVVAYQMLVGGLPFEAESLSERIVAMDAGAPADLEDRVSDPRPVPLLRDLLAPRPEERPSSALEVIERLSRALDLPRPRATAEIRDSFLTAARMVGRRREMSRLGERLSRAESGRGSVMLLAGESGVGKSRLLDELRTLALVKGALVLEGQEVRDGKSPYQLWRRPLLRLCLERPPGPEDAVALRGLVPDSALGTALGASGADPVATKRRLHETVHRLLEGSRRPTLVLLEDLQWSGDESLELLAELPATAERSRLLIVGTFRHGERPDLGERVPGAELMTLERLPPRAVKRLSVSMLGEAGRGRAVLDLLERETEGNAFFIVEVARALTEDAGPMDGVDPRALPDAVTTGGMRRILRRRLARVPEPDRRLLEPAAVAGRELDLDLLRGLAQGLGMDPERLEPWLRACATAAVLEVRGETWRFAHDKLRETLLAELDPEHRRRLHRAVGEQLMARHGNAPEHLAAQAYHFRQAALAGDPAVVETAIDRLARAGRGAVDACATGRALELLTQALDLLAGRPRTEERLRREMELQNERGAAYLMSKGHAAEEVRQCFKRSRQLCEELGDRRGRLPVLLGLWRHHVVRGHVRTARDLARELLAGAEAEGDDAFRVLAESVLGTSLLYLGETAAAWSRLERAVELYDRLTPEVRERAAHAYSYGQNPGVSNLVYGACALWCLGEPDRAIELCRRGRRLADRLDHPFSRAFAAVVSSWVHQFRDEPGPAGELATVAIDLSRVHGFPLFSAVGTLLRGWSLAVGGRAEEGVAMMRQILDLLEAGGSDLLRPYFLALLAEGLGRAGDAEAGLAALAEASEIAERGGQQWWRPELYRLEGELLALDRSADPERARERLELARGRLEKALELARERGEEGLARRAVVSLDRLCL